MKEHEDCFVMGYNSDWIVMEETKTIDPDVEAPAKEKAKPEEKETPEDIKKRARKPPSEGKCKRCGEHRQLNRQKICYPCFVIVNLQKEGWKEGQAHPDSCGCELPLEHDNKDGTQRGMN